MQNNRNVALGLQCVNVLALSAKVKHISYLENRSDRWLQLREIRARIEKTSLWRVASYQRWNLRLSPNYVILYRAGWRVAANKLNKQSWTDDKGWSSSLGVGRGANNPSL